MNPTEYLPAITLAVSGWTLLEVIRLKMDVAVLKASKCRHCTRGQDDD